ncbi:hypothetical protein PGT21_036454 [Puccinia graminis f. sp. tritici]|uniref:Uncharacterized protein n=1 Tax=Puccinia graminis f. sp. tritici TaxID=56615 RepID=A0A5B0MGD7_PUCGR|nr:hypothetical protein PGTUg99_037594 [Puccinia graminis f. sp. tritici]KAA1091640.1 hypothetical protein PGT21_036454 [Puccinia graminis f. sp. tritici]
MVLPEVGLNVLLVARLHNADRSLQGSSIEHSTQKQTAITISSPTKPCRAE